MSHTLNSRYARRANDHARSETLVVFLPGAFLSADEFAQRGFIKALVGRGIDADALLVDADVSFFYSQSFVHRLHDDVVEPYRALGYKRIWLVGTSIGGFGALIHELAYPGSVDGIVAIAPYLGRRPLAAEIRKAGGLRVWRKPEGPPPDQEVDRKLWPMLQRYAFTGTPAGSPPLFLGYGLSDRFAPTHQVLADALPLSRVFTTQGGHDWPQWTTLWEAMLESLPLPRLGPNQQPAQRRLALLK